MVSPGSGSCDPVPSSVTVPPSSTEGDPGSATGLALRMIEPLVMLTVVFGTRSPKSESPEMVPASFRSNGLFGSLDWKPSVSIQTVANRPSAGTVPASVTREFPQNCGSPYPSG